MKRKRNGENSQAQDETEKNSEDTDSLDSELQVDLGLVKEEVVSDDEITPITDLKDETADENEGQEEYVSINAEVIKKAITAVNRLTDDCYIFGEFVANQLRSLKHKKMKMKLQGRIQKAILKVAEEDEEMTQH